MHGYRQFVFWYVWLGPRTNATPKLSLNTQIIALFLSLLPAYCWLKVGIMLSRYVLHNLGYSYDTMVITISC